MPLRVPTDEASAALVAKALKLDSFFPKLGAAGLAKYFPASGVYGYRRGEFILKQGERSRDMYVVCLGSVAITQERAGALAQLASLGPGSIFGEIAIILDGPRVANAVSEKDSRVFKMLFADVERLRGANIALAEHLAELAGGRSGF